MTSAEIIIILEACEKYGVSVFKMGDLSIEMGNSKAIRSYDSLVTKKEEPVIKTEVKEQNVEDMVKALALEPELTSEEILYYAVPYYDELQAEKEEKAQAAKEKATAE